MPEQAVQRKLAAILAADIAGYGRLLGCASTGVMPQLLQIAASSNWGDATFLG